jgi:hypothetical protein
MSFRRFSKKIVKITSSPVVSSAGFPQFSSTIVKINYSKFFTGCKLRPPGIVIDAQYEKVRMGMKANGRYNAKSIIMQSEFSHCNIFGPACPVGFCPIN